MFSIKEIQALKGLFSLGLNAVWLQSHMHAKNLPLAAERHKSSPFTSVHYLKRLGRFPKLDRIIAHIDRSKMVGRQMANPN